MRTPDLSNERHVAWALVAVLVALIVGRLAMAEYGMEGPVFRAMLALIYLDMLLLVIMGIRHVWRSRDVLKQGR